MAIGYNWFDMLPYSVAELQIARYRWFTALRMRNDAKMTYKEIGRYLGVGVERARQIVLKAERCQRAEREGRKVSPVEEYFGEIELEIQVIWPKDKIWRLSKALDIFIK